MSAFVEDISESTAQFGVPNIPENVHYGEGKPDEIKFSSSAVYQAEPFSNDTKGRLGLKGALGPRGESLPQIIDTTDGKIPSSTVKSKTDSHTQPPTKSGGRSKKD